MDEAPIALCLEPQVDATFEACEAVRHADLVILGPGSFNQYHAAAAIT